MVGKALRKTHARLVKVTTGASKPWLAPILPQSLAYQRPMSRLVTLIVLIFAFASVAGTATAHAHRYFSTPIVVLNHVDDSNRSVPVFVEVQRGEIDLGSGIMLPCGAHHAIPVADASLPVSPPRGGVVMDSDAVAPHWPSMALLRPPIGA